MSAVFKVALAVGIAALIARAFFGPPPGERHGAAAVVLGVAGAGAYVAGVVFALVGPSGTAAALLAAGSVALAAAVWCLRAPEAAPPVAEPEPVAEEEPAEPLWDHRAPRP